jgi:hypothetical protein
MKMIQAPIRTTALGSTIRLPTQFIDSRAQLLSIFGEITVAMLGFIW